MKRKYDRPFFPSLFLLLSIALPLVQASGAVPRDYLTPKEIEQVKLAQAIDLRIDVFIKAAERRLMVLAGQAEASSKQTAKEIEKWGDLPTGTRAELIMDVANILDAAITNLDDLAARDQKNPLLAKALRKLGAAVSRFQPQLASMRDSTQVITEHRAIEQVANYIQEILTAASQLPQEEKKK